LFDARSIKTPVATGENHYTRFEFKELCERRAARYLMPDVCRANGFSETLKIGHLAAAHGLMVSPHVVHELSLHVAYGHAQPDRAQLGHATITQTAAVNDLDQYLKA
jgi:L-alanine-DL-glutamate epimerase-like enolase superfamily enzyme